VRLYHWERCSTCRQTRELLADSGQNVEERDFFAEPLGREELAMLISASGGVRNVVSTASPRFKAAGKSLENYSEGELFDLILGEPRLLRRPLLAADDGRVLIGRKAIEAQLA
jgi:Spx/MgsR family transcriptional regulator